MWYTITAGRRGILRWTVPACLVVACSSDANCIYYPCAQPEAAEISVTASNAPSGIPGLTMAVSGSVTGGGPCDQGAGATNICRVMGGPGPYQVELSAPGYQTAALKFTVTGTAAGCNTCGHVDLQRLSVVMTQQ